MIIRTLCRRPNALRPVLSSPATCRATPASVRYLGHRLPDLANHRELVKDGIPGLLSQRGFDVAYTQYQQHVIDELNILTPGTPFANQQPQKLIIDTARNPETAYLFNCASMAFNNHFFFKGINADPNLDSAPSDDMRLQINNSFSSLETLRTTFLDTAEAMFGPGFTWLVQVRDRGQKPGPFRILNTYIAGSPLSGAHYRRQSDDMNNHSPQSAALNNAGSFGSHSAAGRADANKPQKALGGVDITPILCVNTWEHVWLHDYGIKGKREFLENWWTRIDWRVAQQLADLSGSRTQIGRNTFTAPESYTQ